MPRLTKRILDAVKPDPLKEVFIWCSATPGFGARIYPSGKAIFIAQLRVGRAQRRIKIGQYGPFTVDQAREKADAAIRAAAEGIDPQRVKQERKQALTVAELCDDYMQAARAGRVLTRFGRPKKNSTLAIDAGRVERHVKPLIGKMIARDVKAADITKMSDDIAAGKTAVVVKSEKPRGKAVVTGGAFTASRVVELLGGIWSWAGERELVAPISIVRSVRKARSTPKERVLSSEELKALGDSIQSAEEKFPLAAAAVRLIALMGTRRQEVVTLKRSELDLTGSCLQLGDTKTGRSTRAIGAKAVEILEAVAALRLHDVYLFPNSLRSGPAELKKPIAIIFDAAGLSGARSQTLRRTFASIGDELGYNDAIVGVLLGHKQRSVAERHYIRRPDAALVAAATRISNRIADAMDGKSSAEVTTLPIAKK